MHVPSFVPYLPCLSLLLPTMIIVPTPTYHMTVFTYLPWLSLLLPTIMPPFLLTIKLTLLLLTCPHSYLPHDCFYSYLPWLSGPYFYPPSHRYSPWLSLPIIALWLIKKKKIKKKCWTPFFWEWCRPFHSDTQVGRLKAPKPVYCQDWTGYSPDDQLKHEISN